MDNRKVQLMGHIKVLHLEVWGEIIMDIREKLPMKLRKSNSVELQVKMMA
jgi:hypothetical protein